MKVAYYVAFTKILPAKTQKFVCIQLQTWPTMDAVPMAYDYEALNPPLRANGALRLA